ncbi:MAG: hypothetical protein JRN51_09505 [Nitrososphaerota archaeon]|nr:hypothetical protein [Nitrososphaerota archaeon]
MPTAPADPPTPLKTQTYRFSVTGTRPVLQFDLIPGAGAEQKAPPDKLVIELHSPISGEVFEARTSVGRIEVDRDGRVMYFCQKGEDIGFTLFVGRSVTVTLSRGRGEVLVTSPSKILEVEHSQTGKGDLNSPSTDSVKIKLE